MLEELRRETGLPLPEVLHGSGDLLLLSWIESDGGAPGPEAQTHAADLLAALHGVPRRRFGYSRDTVIGQLPQPNPASDRWEPFFRDPRLLHMTVQGYEEGTVGAALRTRLGALAPRIE